MACVGVADLDATPVGFSCVAEVALGDEGIAVQPDEILGWVRVLRSAREGG